MFVIHVIREDGGVLLGDQVIDLNREFLYIPPPKTSSLPEQLEENLGEPAIQVRLAVAVKSKVM